MSSIASLVSEREALRLDPDEPLAAGLERADVVLGDEPVGGVVAARGAAGPGS